MIPKHSQIDMDSIEAAPTDDNSLLFRIQEMIFRSLAEEENLDRTLRIIDMLHVFLAPYWCRWDNEYDEEGKLVNEGYEEKTRQIINKWKAISLTGGSITERFTYNGKSMEKTETLDKLEISYRKSREMLYCQRILLMKAGMIPRGRRRISITNKSEGAKKWE